MPARVMQQPIATKQEEVAPPVLEPDQLPKPVDEKP